MAGWLAAMLLMLVAGRTTLHELNAFEVLELRSLIGLVMLYPLIRGQGGLRAMATRRLRMHVARNTAHYAGQYLWFTALAMIPIAQVISIEFTMPIWTTLLAAAFLGERITLRKSIAVALGLIGVVVIVRPGVGEVNPGQLVMLVAAAAFGTSIVMMKSLTRTESVVTIIFWMLIVQSLIGLVPMLSVWAWPSAAVWPWLVVLAFCGTFSHYCMTKAMRYAEATIVVPMDFLRVPLSAVVGWLVYAERLDVITLLGAAVILAGNLLNLTGRPAAPVPAPGARAG
jgi:drug/metabolite transporter (DMT)-like permease